ncbi:MAG: DUF1501 domain-containing protein [Gemmatales bacterium]|nr:DUF1501 domain-containing protein [Gemmatales bacterium]MDW8386189.1 DUF1501 domain-containing protein [Gemmatales bacterium]
MRNQQRTPAQLSRRQFLQAGAATLGTAAFATATPARSTSRSRYNCIVLFLTGGPSHLETFDPKPDAPEEIRGPFRPIRTKVPGLLFSEHLPRLAERADRFAVVRSVFHRLSAIHETGQQLLQTGRVSRPGVEYPSVSAILSQWENHSPMRPRTALLPGPLGNTGVMISHGQGAGFLGSSREPWSPPPSHCRGLLRREPDALRERYGQHRFGQLCLLARRMIEDGFRMVTVNMFDTVFNEITWDCHADGGCLASDFDDYKNVLCPMLDQTLSALLDDLASRGLLQQTLVVAMGEFGRTPVINPRGGRDHWPEVWSILLAGGPIPGGVVLGSSDKHGCEPRHDPIPAADVAATILHALGVEPHLQLREPGGAHVPAMAADPIRQLLG